LRHVCGRSLVSTVAWQMVKALDRSRPASSRSVGRTIAACVRQRDGRNGWWAMTERTAVGAAGGDASGGIVCWCCGRRQPESRVVRLGGHPEIAVCLGCARFLHQQARAREDAARPTPAGRARDVLRTGRRLVIRRGWHTRPVIGPLLRRLDGWLP
jgi:hypothetical protein